MKLNNSTPAQQSSASPADSMAEGLHQFGRTWREALNRALDIHGLTLLQWAVLDLVRERPGMIQVELATAVGIEGIPGL